MEKLFSSFRTFLVLIVFTFAFGQIANAQNASIRTNFYGFTIGKSTKAQVKKALKTKGMKFRTFSYASDYMVVDKAKLGGYVWIMDLTFYKNTLCRVNFTISQDKTHSAAYLRKAYVNICNTYISMYGSHIIRPYNGRSYLDGAAFYDGTTFSGLVIRPEFTRQPMMLALAFMNCNLTMNSRPGQLKTWGDFQQLVGY